MAWVTPVAVTTGDLIAASDWNQDVVNNAKDLNDRFRSAVRFAHEASGTTHGGTATTGSWATCVLNTKTGDLDSVYALSSNQITVPAGTYMAVMFQMFYGVQSAQVRLYDVTNSAVLGLSSSTGGGGLTSNDGAWGVALFTLAGSATVELQYRTGSTVATWGLGYSAGNSWSNVAYNHVLLLKVA